MKLLVHLLLMRLFPAFIVINAAALLGLNYAFSDADTRFIALVVWCVFVCGFISVSCMYRDTAAIYFRQLYAKEISDMLLPYVAPQLHNEIRQVLNTHSSLSRLAYDAIQLRFGLVLFSCAAVIPFLHGFQISREWEIPTAVLAVMLVAMLSMACLSTRKSALPPKAYRWINRMVSASIALSTGASLWVIAIQSPAHFQHVFLTVMSGQFVFLFILIENHLVHRAGVDVSMEVRERLEAAPRKR